MPGVKINAKMESLPSPSVTVIVQKPCSAVTRTYLMYTVVLRGMERHHFVVENAVIAAAIKPTAGGIVVVGMDNRAGQEIRFYVEYRKLK